MAATTLLQCTRFSDALVSSTHDILAALASASVLLRQVCLGQPTLHFPWGFHLRDCLVMFYRWLPQHVADLSPFPFLDLLLNRDLPCSLAPRGFGWKSPLAI
jgi:hypothetical protein